MNSCRAAGHTQTHTHTYIQYIHTYFTDQAEGSVGKSQGWKEVESRTCAAAIKDASTARVAANKVQGSRAAGAGVKRLRGAERIMSECCKLPGQLGKT